MSKKTYYPQRNFDDAFVALVELYTTNNWPMVDLEKLAKHAQEQRAQRAKCDALRAQYLKEYELFLTAQHQRYQHFAAALNAARGAFRNDTAVMAALAPFKRAFSRKTDGDSEQPQPLPQ